MSPYVHLFTFTLAPYASTTGRYALPLHLYTIPLWIRSIQLQFLDNHKFRLHFTVALLIIASLPPFLLKASLHQKCFSGVYTCLSEHVSSFRSKFIGIKAAIYSGNVLHVSHHAWQEPVFMLQFYFSVGKKGNKRDPHKRDINLPPVWKGGAVGWPGVAGESWPPCWPPHHCITVVAIF